MIDWRTMPDERLSLSSPIGLRLIDSFTRRPPIGKIEANLDVSDGSGGWRLTEIQARRTLSGILSYPGLERRTEVVGIAPRLYRIRLNAEFYKPYYILRFDGIEFEAFPYNDSNPPMDYRANPPFAVTPRSLDVKLFPRVNYPFPTYVRVLRGKVVDAGGMPVPNAEVMRNNDEWAVSEDNGTFALPLRRTPNDVSVPIDAARRRLPTAVGTIDITLPRDLLGSKTIPIL